MRDYVPELSPVVSGRTPPGPPRSTRCSSAPRAGDRPRYGGAGPLPECYSGCGACAGWLAHYRWRGTDGMGSPAREANGVLALGLSIVLGVAYSHILRHAQGKQRRMAWTGAVSYLVATVAMATVCLVARRDSVGWREVGYGVVGGLAWVATYWFFMLGLRLAGVSITQCVTWLAVTVPVLAGIMVWGEAPTPLQCVGLALVLVALTLLVAEQPRNNPAPSRWQVPVLLAAFLGEGINSLAMKGYTKCAPGVDDSGVLLCMFGAAAVGMVGAAALAEARPGLGDLGHGVLLGAVIAVANPAFMAAIRQLPAPVMFPSFWAGSVVLTAVVAMWLWHERYRPRALAGMAIAVVAIVLLHLQAGSA